MKVEVEKQLKIKIKVLERCIREYEMYVKEVNFFLICLIYFIG